MYDESHEIEVDPGFETLVTDYSLQRLNWQQTFDATQSRMNKYLSHNLEASRVNPSNFYQDANGPFFGLWIALHVYGGGEKDNIPWNETLEKVGDRKTVEKLLDIMAYCYKASGDVYPWTPPQRLVGFCVENTDGAMEQGGANGIRVSFDHLKYLIQDLKNNDAEKLKRLLVFHTSEFIHERAHREFDEMGFVSPEAVTQGCQFLYQPGMNRIFEHQLDEDIKLSKSICEGTATRGLDNYGKGHIVWMTFLYEELVKKYPDRFTPLSTDGLQNIEILQHLPSIFKSLKEELGDDDWRQYRQELMRALLTYDSNSQGTIIRDYTSKSSEYGFEKLLI